MASVSIAARKGISIVSPVHEDRVSIIILLSTFSFPHHDPSDSLRKFCLRIRLSVNSVPVICILDNSSQANFLSSSLYSQIAQYLPPPVINGSASIRLADGSFVSCGPLLKGVRLQGPHNYFLSVDFYVAPIKDEVIVGKPCFYDANLPIDWRRNSVDISSGDRNFS